MEACFNLLGKKCFHRLSLLGIFIFSSVGTIVMVFLPVFEASEQNAFLCYNTEGKETLDQLRGRCYDEYNKKINRNIPLYAFAWLNFPCVMLICIVYSQYVRVQVENTMEATNVNRTSQQSTVLLSPCEEPPENHDIARALNVGNSLLRCKVFTAYSVHLLIKSMLMTMFLVIQWGVIYPTKFPAAFSCKLMRNTNNSTGNTKNNTSTAATVSDCKNGKSLLKTIVATLVFSVTTLFLVLSVGELIYLFLHKMKSENFTSDTHFCRNYLNSSNNAQFSRTNIATNLEGNNLPPYVIAFQVLPQHPTHEVISRDEVSTIIDKLNELHTNNNGELTYLYLSGNPGSGKSQLSRQIGKRYSDDRKKQSGSTFVMTLNGKTPESLLESYQDFARRLNCTETVVASILNSDQTTEVKIRQLRTQITTRIKNYMSWFIIVDNVEDLKRVSSLLPELGSEEWKGGQVLVTTQDSIHIPSNGSLNQHVSISPGMSMAEACHLLVTVSGTGGDPVLEKVAKVLDYQPLALAAAAFYLKLVKESSTPKFSWYDYLQKLGERKRGQIEEHLRESEHAVYRKTMTTAVGLAVDKAAESDIVLKHTFHFLSLVSHDSLPLEVVINYVLLVDKDQDREDVGIKIRNCSLILSAYDGESPSIRLHRVIHDAIKIYSAKMDDIVTIFEFAVASFYQFEHLDVDKRSLVPHLKALDVVMEKMFPNCRTTYPINSSTEIWESFLYFGQILCDYSEFGTSKHFLTAAFNICMDQDEPDQDQFATSYKSLGNLHEDLGDHILQAKEFFEKTLDIFIKKSETNDDIVGRIYNNLGNIHNELGDLPKAEEFHERALQICTNQLKPDYVNISTSYHNFGNVRRILGNLQKAKTFYERALDIRKKWFGSNHVIVADSYNNLGNIHSKLGNLQQAKTFYERALDIQIERFGSNHVIVADSYNDLGYVHSELGNLEEAKTFHEWALDIQMKQLGPNHVKVANSCINLANVHSILRDLQEVKEFHERALDILIKRFGSNHVIIAASYGNLGYVHSELGNLEQAKTFFECDLDIRIKWFGSNHVIVADSYNNLGNVHRKLGDLEQAKEFFETARDLFIKQLGPNHIKVADSYNNLRKLSDLQQAKEFV